MIVAATTDCFPELSLIEVLERLEDLEYAAVEICIHEGGNQMKPSEVLADLPVAITRCRGTHRHEIVSYDVKIDAEGETHFEQFAACCKLARDTKVSLITIPSGELGMPFNEEVERLKRFVAIAAQDGIIVSMQSEIGRFSEDPNTVVTLCEHVKGLGLTLDPSHYIVGTNADKNYDHILKYVRHVRLRDSTKDKLQVRVGQGIVDYNRIITMLTQLKYKRTLCVDIAPEGDKEFHHGEMRKLRLLLESSL